MLSGDCNLARTPFAGWTPGRLAPVNGKPVATLISENAPLPNPFEQASSVAHGTFLNDPGRSKPGLLFDMECVLEGMPFCRHAHSNSGLLFNHRVNSSGRIRSPYARIMRRQLRSY
jgi:hypothetical protein